MPRRLLVPEDLWALSDESTQSALRPLIDRVAAVVGPAESVTLAEEGLERWFNAFALAQGRAVCQIHGGWITEVKPRIGPGIRESMPLTPTISEEAAAAATRERAGTGRAP